MRSLSSKPRISLVSRPSSWLRCPAPRSSYSQTPLWDPTMTRHIVRVGQTLRYRAMKPYFSRSPLQSSRALFLQRRAPSRYVAVHAEGAPLQWLPHCLTASLPHCLAAYRAIGSHVHNAFTLLTYPASERRWLNSKVPRNVDDHGPICLTSLTSFTASRLNSSVKLLLVFVVTFS